ncbi:MAG: Hpt domain-containing protein [Waddliaceae bacterium]
MSKKPSLSDLRILCIDLDAAFCQLALNVAHSLHLALDSCTADTEISTKYDGYLINYSADRSAIDCIHKIENKREAPIALIVDTQLDKKTYHHFKEVESVDYIIEKSIASHHLKYLLTYMLNKSHFSSRPSEHDLFEKLRKKYNKSIYDKIQELSALVNGLKSDPNQEALAKLKTSVHQLAGSAGSYGYPDISTICSQLEHEIINIETVGSIDQNWLNSLPEFVKKISFYFQFPKLPDAPQKKNTV